MERFEGDAPLNGTDAEDNVYIKCVLVFGSDDEALVSWLDNVFVFENR